jgi:hypothetical protein
MKTTIDEIFKELSVVASLLEDDYLKSILNKYNLIPDEDLLKELKVYIIDTEKIDVNEEENKFKRKWIKIGDWIGEIKFLNQVSCKDEIDEWDNWRYYIILNETVNVEFALQNKKILFTSKEERDSEFIQVSVKLEYFDIIIKR